MKKQIVADAIVYLITMLVAMLMNLLVSAFLETVFVSFGLEEYFGRAIVRIISGFLVGAGVLGALVYRECYKSMEFCPVILAPSVALAGIGHMILVLLLNFNPIFSGGVRDLAGVISFGTAFDSANMIEKIPFLANVFAFFVYLLFEISMALLLGFLGKRSREQNRDTLIGENLEKSDSAKNN